MRPLPPLGWPPQLGPHPPPLAQVAVPQLEVAFPLLSPVLQLRRHTPRKPRFTSSLLPPVLSQQVLPAPQRLSRSHPPAIKTSPQPTLVPPLRPSPFMWGRRPPPSRSGEVVPCLAASMWRQTCMRSWCWKMTWQLPQDLKQHARLVSMPHQQIPPPQQARQLLSLLQDLTRPSRLVSMPHQQMPPPQQPKLTLHPLLTT